MAEEPTKSEPYVVFEDGSRQFRVSEGDEVVLAFRDVEPGTEIELPKVLLTSRDGTCTIGTPVVAGVVVKAEVIRHPHEKLIIQKFRRRKNYRRRTGHKQTYTKVRITSLGTA